MTVHQAATTSTTVSGFCQASQLAGTFAVEPGSAGAGNIVYKLTLTNTSQAACIVSGIPTVTPLDASGNPLEYSASPNGAGTSAKVTLQPGAAASAEARFTPDVDPCGKIAAATLRVEPPGGGTLDVKVDPATRVCNHGAMQWTTLSAS